MRDVSPPSYSDPLSDTEFTQLLHALGLTPWHEALDDVVVHATTPPRLAELLSHYVVSPTDPMDNLTHVLLRCVAVLGPSEDLALSAIPYLNTYDAVRLFFCRDIPRGVNLLSAPPSARFITALSQALAPHLDVASEVALLFDDVLADQTSPFGHIPLLPVWYFARLMLRLPGLTVALLPTDDLSDYTADVVNLILARLATDLTTTLRLLDNPACSLSEALGATRALVSS